MIAIMLEWLHSYTVGTSFEGDFLYSLVSLFTTGEVLEDSLFWQG